MGIFDYALITLFFFSFIGSCASLGATTSTPAAAKKDAP